jgi:thioesterase domain-containing protein
LNQELEKVLHHEIPLTKAMSLRVREASPELVRLYLPIEPNVNHKSTAFGGSLYSGAVLAGWGALWCTLRDLEIKAQIVIAASNMEYLLPVKTHFEAVCVPDLDEVDRAIRVLKRRGKAKVDLEAVISCNGEACASLFGTYGLIKV